MHFRELDQLGWNMLTLSSVVLIGLSIWQIRAYSIQAYRIWKNRSARSISLTFTASVTYILSAFLCYGLVQNSLIVSLNGLTALPALVAMIGAWIYGEPSKKDWLVVAIGSIGLTAFALPIDPKMVFVWFAIAVVIPLLDQLLKLYDAGERGVVSGELLATFLVKNTFFTIFAFTLEGGEPVLKWWAPVWLILSLWLVVKWYLCPTSLE